MARNMNNITEITKRDIFELFRTGYVENNWLLGDEKCFYPYHGRLTEIEFLKKLYPLDKMSSSDSRFENAEGDIWQHTINNEDWESDRVFKDVRFELLTGSDSVLLKFLCAVFHPENRYENGYWKEYLNKIDNLVRKDGYELYDNGKISGRVLYSWRKITLEELVSRKFSPFSVRNKRELETKTIKLSIPKKVRTELVNLFNKHDETHNRTTETNWNYSINTKDSVIEDIKEYYVPKAFDATKNYSETNDFEQFIINNQPYCVFDKQIAVEKLWDALERLKTYYSDLDKKK